MHEDDREATTDTIIAKLDADWRREGQAVSDAMITASMAEVERLLAKLEASCADAMRKIAALRGVPDVAPKQYRPAHRHSCRSGATLDGWARWWSNRFSEPFEDARKVADRYVADGRLVEVKGDKTDD
jgi:hypothetical protein